ncbi:Uncharacterised protein (plasmid) [Citrobacter freundii]|nr:Uncharacterised protein [Citrobacter freundii]
MYHYLRFVPLALIFSAAALALPWFIVRAGYRDLVQITCACVSVGPVCGDRVSATSIISRCVSGTVAARWRAFCTPVDCAIRCI